MRFPRWLTLCSLGICAVFGSCHHTPDSATLRKKPGPPIEATWYDVPASSLAQSRAGEVKFTAASDHYKIGTLLRVTRISNGASVVVEVTDKGLKKSKSGIDVCRGAAEKLDMVSDGVATVTVQPVK